MKEWEKTCREKTGLGFETFKTIAHCDAETLDALLEAASGSIKGTMYFDWLMEYLSLAQSGKNADVKTVVDDIDALIEMLGITPEAFERYCDKTTEDVKAAFQASKACLAASITVPQALKCLNINKKTLAVLQTNTARVLYVNAKITQNIQSSRALLRRS